MNLSATRPSISKSFSNIRVRSGSVYGSIIILAMIAFESFNYGTTQFALQDLLGSLKFAGIPWSTFLALAFCGIDFAGIARLISPDTRKGDIKESWYLFGAWMLAATANAALTWWGVAVAINGHVLQSAAVINTQTLTHVVPVFVAILVWVIRILIIGSLSSALERITESKKPSNSVSYKNEPVSTFVSHANRSTPVAARPITMTRNPRPAAQPQMEPTYHDLTSVRSASQSEARSNQTRL